MNNIKSCEMVPITELLSDIIDSSIYPTFENIRYVTDETLKTWFRAELKPNDILFVNKGTPGRVCLVPDPITFCAAQDMIGLRANPEKIYYKYLFAILRSNYIQQKIANFHVGIAIPHFKKSDMDNLLIPLPDMDIQIKIGNIYFQLSEKIENNNKINIELESMAKTIYDYWFLQFDFPDKNGKPYKSSGGKMVWNEELKKEIPEGWKMVSLSDVCSFNNGINYDKNEDGDKEYRIVNVRNITASSFLLNAKNLDQIKLKSSQADKYIIEPNDILIARSGTPGAIRLLLSNSTDIIYCGFIIKCKPNKDKHRLLLTYSLKMLEGSNSTKTGGSIMQNVSQDTLKQVKICLPTDNIIDKFNDTINVLLDKIQQIINENNGLTSLRDFLLPLLMNGQVGFKED